MKTLGQIEPRVAIEKVPFKISASGAYYLTGNLTAAAFDTGISIDANYVTLDLNGFALSGDAMAEAAISVVPGRTDVTIRNGSINSTDSGIEASGANRVHVESIRVSKCGGAGISLGPEGTVKDSDSNDNGS